jgi:hypothetical protein
VNFREKCTPILPIFRSFLVIFGHFRAISNTNSLKTPHFCTISAQILKNTPISLIFDHFYIKILQFCPFFNQFYTKFLQFCSFFGHFCSFLPIFRSFSLIFRHLLTQNPPKMSFFTLSTPDSGRLPHCHLHPRLPHTGSGCDGRCQKILGEYR